jgi:lactate dehydrogenase-like 2-hydroxyacid dehydrogenase
MDRPTVLIMQPHLAPVMMALEGGFIPAAGWDGSSADDVAEAVVVAGEFPLDKARIAAMPRLKLIACFTSGYDGIDVAWARGRGLPVTHAPAVNHEDVADHAIGLILASRRRIVDGDRLLRSGGWSAGGKLITPSIRGQKLGIVGLGRIGEALAARAQAMGMEVAWWAPRPKASAWPRKDSLLDLAAWSDILAVASRADETNRGLVSAEVIAALGADGLLVNVARGQLVDEDALIAALRSGALGAAALDVYAEEPTSTARWADVPNTVLTPHTAGATREAVGKMLELLIANLTAVLGGGAPVTPV